LIYPGPKDILCTSQIELGEMLSKPTTNMQLFAFTFVPISTASGIHGMNITEVNIGNPPSLNVGVLTIFRGCNGSSDRIGCANVLTPYM